MERKKLKKNKYADMDILSESLEATEDADIKNGLSDIDDTDDIDEDAIEKEKESKDAPLTSNITAYLQSLGNAPLLTPQEEIDIARRRDKAKEDGDKQAELDAINSLVSHNLKYVVKVAKKYATRDRSIDDLIQEGNIGLIIAAKKFNPDMGFRFTTYATWWIRQAITRYILDKDRVIRLPVHLGDAAQKLKKAKGQLEVSGVEPTTEALSEMTGIDAEHIEMMNVTFQNVISTDATVGENGEDTMLAFLEDDSESVDDIAIKKEMKKKINELLDSLSYREREIIKRRFGFDGMEPQTLEEVGREFGITRERIRQLELRTIRRLRRIAEKKQLDSYLDII